MVCSLVVLGIFVGRISEAPSDDIQTSAARFEEAKERGKRQEEIRGKIKDKG